MWDPGNMYKNVECVLDQRNVYHNVVTCTRTSVAIWLDLPRESATSIHHGQIVQQVAGAGKCVSKGDTSEVCLRHHALVSTVSLL